MTRMFKFAGYLMIGILFVYIVNVLYQGNFNIAEWPETARKTAAGYTIAWAIGVIVSIAE